MNELFVYNNFAREAVDVVEAGDICALTGIANASIGDTICSREFVNPLPTIEVGPDRRSSPDWNRTCYV